jgi:hypothetical protein
MSLLPKKVHHLHQGARQGVFQNEKAKARTVNNKETKRNTNTPTSVKVFASNLEGHLN